MRVVYEKKDVGFERATLRFTFLDILVETNIGWLCFYLFPRYPNFTGISAGSSTEETTTFLLYVV